MGSLASTATSHEYKGCIDELKAGDSQTSYNYFSLSKLGDERVAKLPYSIKVLLESAVRNADGFQITKDDVNNILDWKNTCLKDVEIPFKPARVLLQDYTGVPCVVDLAAMRSALERLGGKPEKINPLVPVDLVIDHSVQVDDYRNSDSVQKNLLIEMQRNSERFRFLKWGQKAFQNLQIVPPGAGIVHQVNLEYLARVVFEDSKWLYPDSVVGTDSHTTMINGLGVTGWGVGGIEAEAVMLGQAVSMVLPQVVGFKLIGGLASHVTATDLVLTITEILRKKDVVGKFVEFFGPGLEHLSLADRATIANMAPEYGATMGFFPIDKRSIEYLRSSNRTPQHVAFIEEYVKAQGMFADAAVDAKIEYTELLELDLKTVVPSVAGPKRPQDRVVVAEMKKDFRKCLEAKVGFKGFGLTPAEMKASATFNHKGKEYTIRHGAVVIAAITSCTNTSNPSVMIGAGLLAQKAVAKGLRTKEYIKTSLAPGSHVASEYFAKADLQKDLDALGFNAVGYGCTTCIGNSGDIPAEVQAAIEENGVVASAVLSGNRNFEGRVHPATRANYLASPPLVVAYALAGSTDFDFETEPLGNDKDGKAVFLKDIWPSSEEIQKVINATIVPAMYEKIYKTITEGFPSWKALEVSTDKIYKWDAKSTYINEPPYFKDLAKEPIAARPIKDAYCLLNLGDSITTDHISPAGNIDVKSPAGDYLTKCGVAKVDFNSYGARRGHDEVMARGTFANTRLMNKLMGKTAGPKTIHIPSNEVMYIYDAAAKYKEQKQDVIILGGSLYGSGSSRDWAAKGPYLQGVRAVIAVSFERIHRSNLVGMGVIPLCFKDGETADSLGLTGKEQFTIDLPSPLKVGQDVKVTTSTGKEFTVRLRIDTAVEMEYYNHGGILQYVLRKMLKE